MKLLENQHTALLARAMDAYALRQKITASNVANLDTPGYNKRSVSFEQELLKAADSDMGQSTIDSVRPEVVETDQAPVLEEEMLEMADTQVRVNMVTRALRQNFELIRSGITGRTG